MLRVPPETILAFGSRDPQADAARQTGLAAQVGAGKFLPPQPVSDGDWDLISGEILTLERPAQQLPPLDALEDFVPGRASVYHRVLVQTVEPAQRVVWVYIAPDGIVPANAIRWTSSWP